MAGAAIAGKRDELVGLKENVIIGKLIPAGTGYEARLRKEEAKRLEAEKPEIDLATVTSSLLIDDNTDESVLEAMISAAAESRAKEVAAAMVLVGESEVRRERSAVRSELPDFLLEPYDAGN